ASPDRSLPLLPEGRIRLDSVGEMDVTAGGRTRRVAQYSITGFGFEPYRLWLDPDRRFFAAGSEWFALVQEGWQEALPALFRVQDQAQEAWMADLARRLSHRQTAPVVFRNANLFDAETGASRPGTTVVITGNRITAVGPDATTAVPAGATVIDARGKALLPGLWDMHVHAGLSDGLLHLAAGVTSVRDLGNDSVATPRLAREWNAGTGLGPRIVLAGFIDGPGPFSSPVGSRAATEAEARAAVAWYADHGYEHIKMYSSLDPKLVPVIADEAHRRGMRVSGHVPEGMRAADVVLAGYDEVQHVNMMVLNFLPDSLDTRTPQRFVGPAQQAADIDLSSPAVREFVALLRERGTVVDPTMSAFEGMFIAREGVVSPTFAAVADRMPANVRRGFLTGGLPVPEGMDQRYRDSWRRMMELVKLLYDAGVTIVPGTDNMAGFALHRELELYVEAGIPAPEVLRIATLGAATVARRADRLGSIAPGKLADVILVDGDPARSISDIRRVELVVKDGVVYRPNEMYEAFGVLPMPARN
ncbi:MAG TPA: amidohydrolase family protein, partial [Longimicrobium sp.]|nr:amidohydrolase family protein [Longimicrobium sp.]